MRRLPVVLITLAVVLGSHGAAFARPPDTPLVPGLPVYLALGDSVAAGQESAPRTADFAETVAAWKSNGYAGQFAGMLRDELNCRPGARHRAARCRHLQYLNIATPAIPAGVPGTPPRSGVTTSSLIDEQLDVATQLLDDRNNDRNPRNDVKVVTLTVGGNDVFGPVIAACVLATPPSPKACEDTVRSVLSSVAVNYDLILAKLRAAAGPKTVIETMTYYNPLPFCALSDVAPFGDVVLEQFPVVIDGIAALGLNGVIRRVSGEHDAIVADTYGTLTTADQFVGMDDCLHPTKLGHTTIAGVFNSAFRAAHEQ